MTACLQVLPVWFENWTEFTASISNPKTCRINSRDRFVRALVWGPTNSQQVPKRWPEHHLQEGRKSN
jgi:hypothetical protein